jgi:hypothetical protein
MSTLIIKLDEANTSLILDVLGDELERGSIGAYHLLIEDGTPLDPTDGSPHLAPERDEAMLYAAAPDLLEALALIANALSPNSLPVNGMMASYDHALMVREEADRAFEIARAAIAKATKP